MDEGQYTGQDSKLSFVVINCLGLKLRNYLLIACALFIAVGAASLWIWFAPATTPPDQMAVPEMQTANTEADPAQKELQLPPGPSTQAFPVPASPPLQAEPLKSAAHERLASLSEPQVASKPEVPVPPNPEREAKESSTVPEPTQISLPPLSSPAARRPTSSVSKRPAAPSTPKRSLFAGKAPSREPEGPIKPATKPSAKFHERLIRRRPAQPGLYETITVATARSAPSNSSRVVDRIQPGEILSVTGSKGEWLVVHSKRKDITVYVKRDEAMHMTNQNPWSASLMVPESRWKDIEREIQRALTERRVTEVTVSFIGDTAYLSGTVKTQWEKDRAVMAARSIPDVKHIFKGIRVDRTWHFEGPNEGFVQSEEYLEE